MKHPRILDAEGVPVNVLSQERRKGLLRGRRFTTDSMMTFDAATIDSTGVFLIGELERLDQTLHGPLVSVSWGRDIDLREDVTLADEISSFTNSTFAGSGGIVAAGKAWVSKDANAIPGVSLDIGKTANPLTLWAMELKWTIPELVSAMRLGRPVDAQKYEAMELKHNMDIDEQVYVGDTTLGFKGLLNHPSVTPQNVANGASTSPHWSTKTPDEILVDFNSAISSVWQASGWAVMPTDIRIPPSQFGALVSAKVSTAGNMSVLNYLKENNLVKQSAGRDLNIQPLKWCIGLGAGGTQGTLGTVDRMLVYSKDPNRVRFPMTPLQRTPLEYRSLYQITTYFGRLGVVEVVYPETIGYFDGI